MSGVTYSEKRYIAVCPGCDRLFDAERRDTLTCSSACRVRAHRSGDLQRLRATAKSYKVHPAGILHAKAMHRLRPDLAARVMSEDNFDPREDVVDAFDKLVFDLVREGAL